MQLGRRFVACVLDQVARFFQEPRQGFRSTVVGIDDQSLPP
jgi:hypothetical protein